MNLKVGDKLLCKISFEYHFFIIQKDKWYEITDETIEMGIPLIELYGLDQNNSYCYIYIRTELIKNRFSGYFYTEKELRKIKLNIINRI